MDKLKVYNIAIDEEEESYTTAIALVDVPAVESNFMAFSATKKKILFSYDDEKQELIGAAMIPDMNIFRIDPDTQEEYYVTFSKDSIRKMSQIFMKKGFQNNMNIGHTDTKADSYVYQSFIVDESKGINSPKGLDLPEGTWVIGVKVSSPDLWASIKAGKQKGFSVEGLYMMAEKKARKENTEEMALLLASLQSINKQLSTINK